MAMKRKHEADSEDASPVRTKQMKLVPFPNMHVDTDVMMSDSEPLSADMVHSRLQSNASSIASDTSETPSLYPTFDIYPHPFFSNNGTVDPNSHNFPVYTGQLNNHVGLMQPTTSFVHHSADCTQIPKLRVACASGVNGQRSMWTHCEQCGAISMVDSD